MAVSRCGPAFVVLLFGLARAGELPAWVEAEAYAEQRGSQAPFYAMPGASGGKIVDNDWGGRATDLLRHKVKLPAAVAKLHVTLRYARAMRGDAVVLLQLDGRPDPPVRVALPPTGGRGFARGQWRLAHAELPAASASTSRLCSAAPPTRSTERCWPQSSRAAGRCSPTRAWTRSAPWPGHGA